MSSIGQTIVTARGATTCDLTGLRARIARSAQGKLAFTLSGFAAPIVASDGRIWWTCATDGGNSISLSIGLAYDQDCLDLVRILSEFYPALTLHGRFSAESRIPESHTLGYRNGQKLYEVRFDGANLWVRAPSRDHSTLLQFYARSDEAELAAAEHLPDDGLSILAAGPPIIGPWCRHDEGGASLFFRPPLQKGGGLATIVETQEITMLSEVDMRGGYACSEAVPAAGLDQHAPELRRAVRQVLRRQAEDQVEAARHFAALEDLIPF